MDLAPVIPSLKSPVIREFISRITRLTATSFFWNSAIRSPDTARSAIIHRASCRSVLHMTKIANRI